MGLSWLLNVSTRFFDHPYYIRIASMISKTMTGFVIFVTLVISKKKVRNLLQKKFQAIKIFFQRGITHKPGRDNSSS